MRAKPSRRYGLALMVGLALLPWRSAAWAQGYRPGIPPGGFLPGGIVPGDSVASAADRARRRMEAETAIRQQDLAARTRQQQAIARDRAALDASRGQRGASSPATPEQWRREQALQNDIDRRIAVQRRGVTVTPTGPGAWIVRDGEGATQGVCREIGGVLTC
ncbi:hypothetical protein HLH36_07580 [Gluconacetobacter aggeris]|uniref:Uncharacterized protein n=1 Tax=Gluconacetobacter aggeris TaxID=1286186 RepID=A0A7W4ISM2_9PROT|nr:hypothetical protein [Gluconacetobacter aggeris]MBB2168213.1 hypothetical protein [Gluconacetobacter aggeris]